MRIESPSKDAFGRNAFKKRFDLGSAILEFSHGVVFYARSVSKPVTSRLSERTI